MSRMTRAQRKLVHLYMTELGMTVVKAVAFAKLTLKVVKPYIEREVEHERTSRCTEED